VLESQDGYNKNAIPTPNSYMNYLLKGGNIPGDLSLRAANTGEGKTAKLIDEINCSEKYTNVLLYSLEMSGIKVVGRIVANKESLNSYYFSGVKKLDKSQLYQVDQRMTKLKDSNIYIDESSFWHIDKLRIDVKRNVKEFGIGIVFIDYLQLIDGTGKTRNNREQEISYVSRMLKGIAKENDIPVVAAVQFGKDTYQKTPSLKDLRESHAIAQSADVVIAIYTTPGQNPDADSNIFDSELILLKNRDGMTHKEDVKYNKSTNSFRSIDKLHAEPPEQPPMEYYNEPKERTIL